MKLVDQIRELLDRCSLEQRREVYRYLQKDVGRHALEEALNTTAEVILEAIHRAGNLTLRMFRGVIAEAAFEVEVIDRLNGWKKEPRSIDVSYDYLLTDANGNVRTQVKLQRSKSGMPMTARQANKSWSKSRFVVETQKTRGGVARNTKTKTRPYRYDEFDILAVSLYPSCTFRNNLEL
ncbi:MAG TPA: hypothetical protein VGJ05_12275 [Fimbriiglobus sp.]